MHRQESTINTNKETNQEDPREELRDPKTGENIDPKIPAHY
jgi:hypothetical protein